MAVIRATIHHEGAGTPTDDPRGAAGGYSYWIGTTRWIRLRSPYVSYATLNFNHVSLDICLSGDRMVSPVSDHDIGLIHGAYMDCLAHGEVSTAPLVVPHRYSPGSSSVCPGDKTMARWSEVVSALRPVPPPTPPPVVKVQPHFHPALQIVDSYSEARGSWGLEPDGGIITWSGAFYGGMVGDPNWGHREGARLVKPGTVVVGANPPLNKYPKTAVYEIIASSGERYIPTPP